MNKNFELGRVMMAVEILENYEWEESAAGSKALAVIRAFVEQERKSNEVLQTSSRLGLNSAREWEKLAGGGIFGPEVEAELEKFDESDRSNVSGKSEPEKPAKKRRPATNKPATPEEQEKFEALIKLAKQTNAATIEQVITLAGRNGLGKAALERLMVLPANAICHHFNKPARKVERAFAEHFGVGTTHGDKTAEVTK